MSSAGAKLPRTTQRSAGHRLRRGSRAQGGGRSLAVTLALAAWIATATPGSGDETSAAEQPGTTVIAESQFGNGTVSGLLRKGRNDRLEVQLPSGSWIECRSSCRETLRVETVDFWQAQSKITNECGIFGCLELRYPRR